MAKSKLKDAENIIISRAIKTEKKFHTTKQQTEHLNKSYASKKQRIVCDVISKCSCQVANSERCHRLLQARTT